MFTERGVQTSRNLAYDQARLRNVQNVLARVTSADMVRGVNSYFIELPVGTGDTAFIAALNKEGAKVDTTPVGGLYVSFPRSFTSFRWVTKVPEMQFVLGVLFIITLVVTGLRLLIYSF